MAHFGARFFKDSNAEWRTLLGWCEPSKTRNRIESPTFDLSLNSIPIALIKGLKKSCIKLEFASHRGFPVGSTPGRGNATTVHGSLDVALNFVDRGRHSSPQRLRSVESLNVEIRPASYFSYLSSNLLPYALLLGEDFLSHPNWLFVLQNMTGPNYVVYCKTIPCEGHP